MSGKEDLIGVEPTSFSLEPRCSLSIELQVSATYGIRTRDFRLDRAMRTANSSKAARWGRGGSATLPQVLGDDGVGVEVGVSALAFDQPEGCF